MRAILKMIRRSPLSGCERGATAVEYGLILAMVVLAIVATLNVLATKTTNMWGHVSNEVTAH